MAGSWRTQRLWTAYLLGVLTVAGAMLLTQGLAPRPAYAQLPDSGAQRNEMILEQKATNQKLTEILAVLKEIRDQGVPGKVARQLPAAPGGGR